MDEWEREDATLLLVKYYGVKSTRFGDALTVKEMQNYLEELYVGKNNLNYAFDVI